MVASTPADPGRIFISYRREDSAFPAGWLYDRLCARFGGDYVFKDVDSIDPGDDFLRVIEDAVGRCQVLLALIGDRWLDIADGTGHRRLDDPNDFVRLEIEAALRRDVRVIPILVGRAPLPTSEQLPETLRGLIRRQAIELSPNRFEPDVARLVRTIDKTLAAVGGGRAHGPAPVDPTSRSQGTAGEGHADLLADPQWVDAANAFWNERWAEAVRQFEALEARYPGDDRVQTRLKDARRQRDIDAYSRTSEAAAADGDWDTAVTALENLAGLDPNYADITARLEQARIAQRRKAIVDEMTGMHQAGRWEGVVAAAKELARLDPDNPDPGGIVADARAKIRNAALDKRYAQAINHLNEEDWQRAADLFAAIEQEQPAYRDAAALLTTAQRQRDLAAWSEQAAAAAGKDDWDIAVTALESICAIDPAYRDAGVRLEQARSAQRRRALVEKVTALHQAERWNEVVALAKELAQLDPDDADPGGLVADARGKLRDAELADRYAQGVDHLKQARWQHAADAFGAIEKERPGYRDTSAQLKRAQENLAKTAQAEEDSPTSEQLPRHETISIADLDALVAQSGALSSSQQRELVDRLRALLLASPAKRQTGRALLESFSRRTDLYQDVAVSVKTMLSDTAGGQSHKESQSASTAADPRQDEDLAAPTPTTRLRRIASRRKSLVIAGAVGGAIVVGISIGLPLVLNSEAYKLWQSNQTIENANVGDCIHREYTKEGKLVVSMADCQTASVTDVVIGKTDNNGACPSGPIVGGVSKSSWVQTNSSPPVILCLSPK